MFQGVADGGMTTDMECILQMNGFGLTETMTE